MENGKPITETVNEAITVYKDKDGKIIADPNKAVIDKNKKKKEGGEDK